MATAIALVVLLPGGFGIAAARGRPADLSGIPGLLLTLLVVLGLFSLFIWVNARVYEFGFTDRRLLGRLDLWQTVSLPWQEVTGVRAYRGWLERRSGATWGTCVVSLRGKWLGLFPDRLAVPVDDAEEFVARAAPFLASRPPQGKGPT